MRDYPPCPEQPDDLRLLFIGATVWLGAMVLMGLAFEYAGKQEEKER